MTRFIKRGGKVWIRMFPDKPITKKPAETRMGKGKGAPEEWVCVIRPGKILFEMEGVPLEIATEAMRLAAHEDPAADQAGDARTRDGSMRDDDEGRQNSRDSTPPSCRTSCREIEEQMFRLRFQMSMGQTEGLKKYRELRKDRARMLSILRERNSIRQGAGAEEAAAEGSDGQEGITDG